MNGPDVSLPPAWRRTAIEVAASLNCDPHLGLEPGEVDGRLQRFGPNAIREGRRRGPVRMLLDQFTDFMILVLLAAAVVSGLIGDLTDTIVILVIVVLNALVGFIQQYRAEAAIAALRQLAAPQARVLRAGHAQIVPSADLVPGDIVLLEDGSIVPADLRLIDTSVFRTQESALTGESAPIDKRADAVLEDEPPIGDRVNMAWKGTVAVHGRARGVVVATGMATELGRIASLLSDASDTRTPLQKRLARFGRILAIAVLLLCAALFGIGVMRGEPVMLMLLTAISLAVAAIPEALPAVVTVALALGARRMVRRHALIRKLPAVETLGSVTFICADKTGTLTLNQMRVEEIWHPATGRRPPPAEAPDDPALVEILRAMALNNDTRLDRDGRPVGDPTEIALFEAARDAGSVTDTLDEQWPRVAELPFDAERRCMTTLHRPRTTGHVVAYIKGSPETVLALSARRFGSDGGSPLDVEAALQTAARMAADGLRVLALARREFHEVPPLECDQIEAQADFLGLVGLLDPPREEAAAAVADCRAAGIVPVMITGDHPETACAIARRLGILDSSGEVLTGADLAKMPDAEFAAHVRRVRVYARAAPEHKIRIVQALQDQGQIVAMTGDGVNDAPALKRSDIGVAMGIAGTDVAREAAHMTLLDDNFATIVSAVREGRRIFDNIRKFVRFVMTGNTGEIGTLFVAPFLGLPIPLLPIHILWVNLVTDGLPGLALATEPEERGIMQRPPRRPRESLFAHGIWQHIIWVGSLITALCLLTQAWAIHVGSAHWQTMVFTVLTLAQMWHVLAIRSERESLFALGVTSNLPLLGAVLLTFALQLATIYIPWLQPIFKTQALTLFELVFCIGVSSLVFVGVEVEKWAARHGWLYASNRGRAEG